MRANLTERLRAIADKASAEAADEITRLCADLAAARALLREARDRLPEHHRARIDAFLEKTK